MKDIVDWLLVEEARRQVASAWKIPEGDMKKKKYLHSYIPRSAFAFLVCDLLKQPSVALSLISKEGTITQHRGSSFRFVARRRIKKMPAVYRKTLGVLWYLENNVIRYDPRGCLRVPHNMRLVQLLKRIIAATFERSEDDFTRVGCKLPFVTMRRIFCHLACEIFGQPSNILHHIGLYKDYSWREFRIQTRRWWKRADPSMRRRVEAIRRIAEESNIPLHPKPLPDQRILRIAAEEVARAWDIPVSLLRRKYSKKKSLRVPRLAFTYLVCKLLLQPASALKFLHITTYPNWRLSWQEARWYVESHPELYRFLFGLRDRVRSRLSKTCIGVTPRWAEVGQSIEEYVKSLPSK